MRQIGKQDCDVGNFRLYRRALLIYYVRDLLVTRPDKVLK